MSFIPAKKCTKCGLEKPVTEFYKHSKIKSGLAPSCKTCMRAQSEKWKAANKERYKASIAKWWREHPEKKKAKDARRRARGYFAEYAANNKERIAVRMKAWTLANKEKRRRQIAAWNLANKDRVKARIKAWKTPDRIRVQNHKRRARKLAAPGTHSPTELAQLFESQQHLCAAPWCRTDLNMASRHLDHKVPLSRGGSNDISNLQWLCQKCNCEKWTKTMDEWLAIKGAR